MDRALAAKNLSIMTHTEKIHQAYDTYKEKFSGSLHNVLWQVLVNDCIESKVACFTSNYDGKGGAVLGIATANEYGYIPTAVYFKTGTPYNEIRAILKELNKIVFDLDDDACSRIVASSMRKQVS